MKWPRKKAELKDGKIFLPELKVVFLHVPKCAGVSIVHSLYHHYGKRYCARLDIKVLQQLVFIDDQPAKLTELPRYTKVIHGHFRWDHLNNVMHIPDGTRVFTWIRDPLSRLVSNHTFYIDKLKGFVPKRRYGLLKSSVRRFDEFIEISRNKNILNRFLGNTDPRTFFFIGDVEHYADDFSRLADAFSWKQTRMRKLNKSEYKLDSLSSELIERVKDINFKDYETYDIFSQARKKIIDDSRSSIHKTMEDLQFGQG